MICKNCNKEIPNDSVFCEFCGHKITDDEYLDKKSKIKTKIEEYKENNGLNNTIEIGLHKHYVDFYSYSRGKGIIGIILLLALEALFIVLFYFTINEKFHFERSLTTIFIFGFVIVVLFLMIIFFFKGLIGTILANKSLLYGESIKAKLVNSFVSESNSNNKTKLSYYIVYKYKIGDIVHQTTQKVSKETFDNLKIGSLIDIKISNILGSYEEKTYI